MYYNFNVSPRGYGKTYYEINKSWKELKNRIKQILDCPNSCKEIKILDENILKKTYNLSFKDFKKEILKSYDEDIKYN